MKRRIIKKESGYVTKSAFEKAMASIARSFSKMDERFDKINERFDRHDKAFTILFKQMQKFTDEAREHRQTMSMLMREDVSQEKKMEALEARIERLETQMK